MQIVETVLALILTLGILVTLHEAGHFWVARRCGVKVLRFSVGFGKPLFSWYDRQGTEFAVAAIPLGGYVKMLDEREGPVPEELKDQAFNAKPPSKRIAIAAAGPIANFLFAIAAYWLLSVVGFTTVAPIVGDVSQGSVAERVGLTSGMEIHQVDGRRVTSWRDVNMRLLERTGEFGEVTIDVSQNGNRGTLRGALDGWSLSEDTPNPLNEFGVTPWRPDVPAVLGEISPGGRAEAGGLKSGDRVVEVDGKPVADWFELVAFIREAPEKPLELTVERDGRMEQIRVTPAERTADDGSVTGFVGAGVSEVTWPDHVLRDVSYGPLAAIPNAVSETWGDTRLTLVAIKKMVTGLLSPTNLSGPITIARIAEASVSSGFEDFIRFLAYLSVSLGVLNLLPIPVLDGGHIVYYTIEAIRRKPLSEQAQAFGLRIGMAMILTLMVFALYNDLMRL
ncbi:MULTISPECIES: RIP metalloprotease RseP [Marinobacter]|jgi:regulator of sigma E protease|uniref:Zinc metalloprotease n=3 Tax=Marinobacter TaxID=2742 RepID=W5Z1F7_9GAMM|nr:MULTISPECIES: RIP metalloprotease RseP [Marinobacter]AHI32323.1 zinc metallopeptidase RseP [Marinobacter salarius]ARM84856.1 regulator of sigma-E protease RseP [Marinobacter salarius]KXJ45386.1 MAG: zinc metallopeptidase RseP [Marinobacter sp. Hex_13]MAB52948.1 RIP metalloprotease RseP [Marinobacter sp.]MBJ7301483.1 RIP metalloprotease RseP [Marinobacter salarius]|tara:strand:+ start:3084 stop:4433 length:1350 start_codon:yes stop_codon:yes gene_type:complete